MFHLSKRAAAVVTAGALVAFQALAIVGAGSAAASGTCGFTLATGTVSVSIDAGTSSTLSVDSTTDEILLDGLVCSLADTTNTTNIVVQGAAGSDEGLYIDETDGLFADGTSWQVALGTGTDDWIEFDLASGQDNTLTVTDTTFTLNGEAGVFGGVESLYPEGGDGNDTIDGSALTDALYFDVAGNAGDDTISGGAGDDYLEGEPNALLAGETGDDTINGGAGDDTIYGDEGDDTIDAGEGDDYAEGEEGADTFLEGTADNGADTLLGDSPASSGDVIDYSGRTTSIIIDPAGDSGADANGDGDASDTGDEQDSISGFDVYMTGSGNDTLTGEALTDETFVPGAGDDDVTGNTGDFETLDFSGSAAGVTVDAAGGTATGEGADTFTDISAFVGSDFDDTFVSDASGFTFTGGDGVDTVDYSAETSGVVADLSDLGASDDTFPDNDVENAMGGSGADDFTGNSLRNSLWGGEGDDTLDGAGGNDTFYGGAGSDDMTGGTGVDLVSFADATSGVDVDLSLEVASSADGDDTVATMEGVVGSAFADNILGSSATNLIKAGKGDDFVRAGTGDDTVKGGGGDDTMVGGGGDDSLYGRAGNDALFGGGGTDYGNGGKGSDTCKGVEIKKSC